MDILYLGADSGTSYHRSNALVRLGHRVRVINPVAFLINHWLAEAWVFKTGCLFLARFVEQKILKATANDNYDLVWVDGGAMLSQNLVKTLSERFGPVINYNIDDPFGHRDGQRWRLYLSSIHHYDLVVVMRDCNVKEAQMAGAKNVLRVFRSADEVAHAPRSILPEDHAKWGSDVLFIGTWLPERGLFLLKLAQRGIPITIYGDRWNKAPEWRKLKRYWRGPGLYADRDYAMAIQTAKICLGFLSKGNRDLHTTRSLEIPSLGSLFLAERTSEHQVMYKEDEEAVFWADADECAAKCKALLADDKRRQRIANAGQARCIANGFLNERVIAHILAAIPQHNRR